jgi:hypothetical protein
MQKQKKKRKYKLIERIGLSMAIALLFKLAFHGDDEVFFEWDLVYTPVFVFIILQGNFQINKWLNTKYSWIKEPRKRLVLQITTSTIFTAITLFVLLYGVHQIKYGDGVLFYPTMKATFLSALLVTFIALSTKVGYHFFNSLRNSLVEVEKYKTESANAQLQNLKNQLNPHFLFNNLSVLTSLVHKDQNKAVDFINELSKVYRYILDNKTSELVLLQEELAFLNHYIYLLKIRFENNISFLIKIDEAQKNTYLPPMCLQMLVENTIQHNEASQAKPLKVSIYTMQNSLIIENQIQPRSDAAQSSKMGLKNIRSRYAYFTDEKVEIINDGKTFKVALPLISKA